MLCLATAGNSSRATPELTCCSSENHRTVAAGGASSSSNGYRVVNAANTMVDAAKIADNVAAAAKGTKGSPDRALVGRGGTCTADQFPSGSGVTFDSAGRLHGVSIWSAAGKTVEQLTVGIPGRHGGVTTVGGVRRAGGDVVACPTAGTSNHCTLCGVTPQQAERWMTPTIRNSHQ